MEKTKTFQLTESQYNLVEELLEIAPGHTEAEKLISALELAVEVGLTPICFNHKKIPIEAGPFMLNNKILL